MAATLPHQSVNNPAIARVGATLPPMWAQVVARLSATLSKEIFNTWFSGLRCLSETGTSVQLAVDSDFAAIWIEENYLDLISKQYAQILGHSVPVKLIVAEASLPLTPASRHSETVADLEPAATLPSARFAPLAGNNIATSPSRIPSRVPAAKSAKVQLNPRYTFDNFIVGQSNQLAHAASVAVAQNLATAYNPLFLYGDTGLGKTHLMQAIAHSVLETNPNANIVYISCEKFTNDFLRAIETKSLVQFRKQYRAADVLLIDDIQFLEGKERTQEEFFHTFNELFESNKQICLTSDRPASEMAKLEARLISRFQWGMVTDLQSPDLETRVAILRRKASLLSAEIPDDILAFLARSITRNVRRMEGALTRVASFAKLKAGQIDLPQVEQLLRDILQEEAQAQLSIEKIQQKVIEYYRLRPSDMQSKRRPTAIAFPRQVAMYLCRVLTNHSLQEIGAMFGGRDHGTVIHACKQVENMMEQDESVKRSVELLSTQLSRRA
jgi:chromosomal replication initiator protein